MSIEREYFDGEITFVCDICGFQDETHCQNFAGALAKFKSHGGRISKDRETGEFEHTCRECSQ